ncbi:Toprim domain-containing protein [Desulfocicer vacuolatum DSM 3385]|uniref:Toprim domain-containing protein n=1 Tax=Desulfocicer vacuolatum DSM 3385 TaxID=1121400 RepID=A0A1W2BQ14_9BACT|nr:AAA family ATPase [Desulfocicer vacuolatum]SMC74722.1 Toprim domain-containing protein [Desulfocicer vacuolatum DSM 3385]
MYDQNSNFCLNIQDIIRDLQAEGQRHGINIPGDLIPGKITRFGPKKKHWCVFHQNQNGTAGASFGDWSTGFKSTWFSGGGSNGSGMSPEDQAKIQLHLEQVRQQADLERAEAQRQAAMDAKEWYDKTLPATTHPYLDKKQIQSHNANISDDGTVLLIPAWDINGNFATLQKIFLDADGVMQKRYYTDGKAKEVFNVLGNVQNSDITYLVEGFATGATVHECTDKAVVVCFTASNLMDVAAYFQEQFPDKKFVIAADNDIETEQKTGKNPGRLAAQAVSEKLGIGVAHCTVNSDFNDLSCLHGPKAVRNILQCVVGEKEKIKVESMTLHELMALNPQVISLIYGLINKSEGLLLHAKGGLGKSMLALWIAICAAMASPEPLFGSFPPKRRITSMFIQTENSGATINARIRKMVGNDSDMIEALKYISMPVLHKDILSIGCPFSDGDFQQWLMAVIKHAGKAMGQPIDIVWIDPLISFAAGDENDSAKMRHELDCLNDICRKCGVTPVVIHHDNRNGDYRGSSAIFDWCRSMIGLKAEFIGSDRITDIQGSEVTHRTASVPCIRVTHEKANNMKKFNPFLLRMDQALNFQTVEEAISPEQMEQGRLIQQAITDLGDDVVSRIDLINTYINLSGVSKATARRHIKTATDSTFISMTSTIKNGKQAYEYAICN